MLVYLQAGIYLFVYFITACNELLICSLKPPVLDAVLLRLCSHVPIGLLLAVVFEGPSVVSLLGVLRRCCPTELATGLRVCRVSLNLSILIRPKVAVPSEPDPRYKG